MYQQPPAALFVSGGMYAASEGPPQRVSSSGVSRRKNYINSPQGFRCTNTRRARSTAARANGASAKCNLRKTWRSHFFDKQRAACPPLPCVAAARERPQAREAAAESPRRGSQNGVAVLRNTARKAKPCARPCEKKRPARYGQPLPRPIAAGNWGESHFSSHLKRSS